MMHIGIDLRLEWTKRDWIAWFIFWFAFGFLVSWTIFY